MRKSGFYPKLAWGNIVRNRQFYVPYLLTLGGTAAAFYIIGALAGARDLPVMNRYIYLSMFMTFGLFVIAIFAVIFLGYTNSFLMKRRRKELGLYNVLGMGKRNIARMLGMETVYTALIGIGGGILAGLLLQKLVTLLLCRIMAFHGTGFSFYVSREGILATIALFTLILLGNLLVNLIRVGRQSPMELMRSASAGEREPKSNWPMAILGILALGGGYAIAVFTNNAGMAFALYFPAVILVIIGTYALFTAVSIVALKALRKNKRYYYQPRHFIGVSGMLYRMRRNAVGLANICILSTMVLVMVSGTLALYLNSQQTLEKQFPAELSVAVRYQADQTPAFDGDAFSARLLAELREKDCPAEILYSYRRFTLSMDEIPGGYFRRHEYQSQTKDINFLTAADAEAITGQQLTDFAPVTLRFPLTAAAEQGNGGADEYSEITVEAAKLTETVPAVGGAFVNINVPVWLAVKDDAALQAVWDTQAAAQRVRIPGSSPNAMVFQTFCRLNTDPETQLTVERELDFGQGYSAAEVGSWERVNADSKESFTRDYYALNGGFFFLGLFLGFLFIMAAVLIIYYKQVSEGYEDRERYRIMRDVGLERKMVKESISSQILVVFFAPLLVAAIHVAFDFQLMLHLLTMFGLHEAGVTLLCTAGTFLVFAVIYGLVYLLTARTYYRIVQ
ncbi:MAG: FtsX-like permease family protein [Dysosmobacter sp.]|nr:FtsX-like permease family protein [Dysosmobacter sp.]